jgi:hypothetical protein
MAQASTLRVNLTRLHKRLTVNTEVQVRRFGQENWHHRGYCTDISEGGLGLKLDLVLQVGEVIEVRFPGGEEDITYRARIIYRKNTSHYGIKFMQSAQAGTTASATQTTLPAR